MCLDYTTLVEQDVKIQDVVCLVLKFSHLTIKNRFVIIASGKNKFMPERNRNPLLERVSDSLQRAAIGLARVADMILCPVITKPICDDIAGSNNDFRARHMESRVPSRVSAVETRDMARLRAGNGIQGGIGARLESSR